MFQPPDTPEDTRLPGDVIDDMAVEIARLRQEVKAARDALEYNLSIANKTSRSFQRKNDEARNALAALVHAVEWLGRIKNGKTLFEHSPTTDEDAYHAWAGLNACMVKAREILTPNAELTGGAKRRPG